jgi:hypothetical protein
MQSGPHYYAGELPVLIDSHEKEVEASFTPGRPVALRCKAEPDEKIWVFVEAPFLFPQMEMVRPNEVYCEERGSYLIPFDGASHELYYADSFKGTRIDFGLNDLTGVGEIVVTTKKGESPSELQLIQRIRIIEIDSA